jgi:nucleotide-binding universal stress UspA family protein
MSEPAKNPTRLITVAIHTPAKAQELKQLLEAEGVTSVALQNVNLDHPEVSAGMRVRIPENDLPLALRIIENREIFAPIPNETHEASATTSAQRPRFVLVPVDFSEGSFNATKAAFRIASNHRAEIVLLHSFLAPYVVPRALPLSNALTFEMNNTAENARVKHLAEEQMQQFAGRIRQCVKSGEIPGVKFTTELSEGVPEDAILAYVKARQPWLIVMATRSAQVKGTELIGSVSAEVMDSCRVQALTVPTDVEFSCFHDVGHIVMLTTLEPEELLAIDAAVRLVEPGQGVRLTLMCLPSPKYRDAAAAQLRDNAATYVRERYPQMELNLQVTSHSTLIADYGALSRNLNANLLVVPNKKKHLLARLFNPGMAHRVLFHFDVPMLVAPV